MRALLVCNGKTSPEKNDLQALLRDTVDPQGPAIRTYSEMEKSRPPLAADLVVVDLTSSGREKGLAVLQKIRSLTDGEVLAIGPLSEPKHILQTLQEGADFYLDQADLKTSIEAVLARLSAKKHIAPRSGGKLLAVLGSGGGVGASTLSANLAAVFAQRQGSVLLVDLKLGRGAQAGLLDCNPVFTLADLCQNLSRLDRAMFEKCLVRHPSGVHLLAGPSAFHDIQEVSTQGVEQTLQMSMRLFPFTVVDMEDCYHKEQKQALGMATTILLAIRLDFLALRNARRILDQLDQSGIPRCRLQLVVNRSGQPGDLPLSEAETVLRTPIAYLVPDDPKTINSASNSGVPAVLKHPRTKVSRSIAELGRHLLEPVGNAMERQSFFRSAIGKLLFH